MSISSDTNSLLNILIKIDRIKKIDIHTQTCKQDCNCLPGYFLPRLKREKGRCLPIIEVSELCYFVYFGGGQMRSKEK